MRQTRRPHLYKPTHFPSTGGGGGQRHHLQLPHQPDQPDAGVGAELRLAPLHALLPARLHPARLHAQPEVPGAAVPDGQPGHDGQPGSHLLLLAHGEFVSTVIIILYGSESEQSFLSKHR